MALRDLGYRPYEGDRRDASKNYSVMLRLSLRRAWRSWMVKLTLLFCWVPTFAFVGALMMFGADRLEAWLGNLLHVQWLLFVFPISLFAGAGAIAYDLENNAFAYLFAKPVTPAQYVFGRVGAVFVLCTTVSTLPMVVLGLVLTMFRAEQGTEAVVAAVSSAAYAGAASLAISLFMATIAVGLSALSRSRTLTLSAFTVLLVVPLGMAWLTTQVAEWPWVKLASPVSSMSLLVDACLGLLPEDSPVRVMHVIPTILGLTLGGLALAYRRVREVEIIA